MFLSLLDFELRTGQRVPRGADAEEKRSFHTHMLLYPVPQPEADPAGEAGLCSVLWSLPPCCPEAPITSPQGPSGRGSVELPGWRAGG